MALTLSSALLLRDLTAGRRLWCVFWKGRQLALSHRPKRRDATKRRLSSGDEAEVCERMDACEKSDVFMSRRLPLTM